MILSDTIQLHCKILFKFQKGPQNRKIVALIDWLIVWLFDWLTDWLVGMHMKTMQWKILFIKFAIHNFTLFQVQRLEIVLLSASTDTR